MIKIFVDNSDYNKLINGESIKVIVDSKMKSMIECDLSFKKSKEYESTGWDNPPRFDSLDQRDLYYK